jgi:periplasmic protein TonB
MLGFSQTLKDTIYSEVEELAEFPGGVKLMNQFIAKNIRLNNTELDSVGYLNYKVFVKFIINEEGEVNNTQIVKGCNNCVSCDKEAVRVIKMMPRWKAGKQSGLPVKTYIMLPVTFKSM